MKIHMKLVRFLMIGLLITTTATLSSCKKDKKKENSTAKLFWPNGGDWAIQSFTYKTESSVTGVDIDNTIQDYGSYTFNKDGTGELEYIYLGETDNGPFLYTNTAENLNITIGMYTTIYKLTWDTGKVTLVNEKKLNGDPGEVITETETMVFIKK